MAGEQDRAGREPLSTREIGERVEALMNAVSQKLIVDPSIGSQLARHHLGGKVASPTSPTLQIVRGETTMQLDYQARNFKVAAGRGDGHQDLYVPQYRTMNFGFGDTEDKLVLARILGRGVNWQETLTGHIQATIDGKVHVNSPSAFAHAYRLLGPILTP